MRVHEEIVLSGPAAPPVSLTPHEFLAMMNRHRRFAMRSFLGVLAGALLVAPMLPKYRADMKILVRNERVDPMLSPRDEPPPNAVVTDEQLNSEAELLKSDDLVRSVAVASQLFRPTPGRSIDEPSQQLSLARKARELQAGLIVAPIPKTHLIEVKYESSSPQLAAKVLNTLADLYLNKHLDVYRSPGKYLFFKQQADRYRQDIEAAEARLTSSNSVAPQLARDMTLQKLADFKATLEQTRIAIRETQQRISNLQGQEATVPSRLTTQVRRSDNPQLLEQLKSQLLDLELKRSELLNKYQPSYPLVREVEQKIADTKAALTTEEASPNREEVTDQNPTHAWIQSELAKAEADLLGLQAGEAATEQTIASFSTSASLLEKKRIVEQDLERSVKEAEENYLLYRRKGEESRISEALDERRIFNVAIAQSASMPLLPIHSTPYYAVVGLGLACFLTVGLVFLTDHLDPSFRTPEEVTRSLGLPVLAFLPKDCGKGLVGGPNGDSVDHSTTG